MDDVSRFNGSFSCRFGTALFAVSTLSLVLNVLRRDPFLASVALAAWVASIVEYMFARIRFVARERRVTRGREVGLLVIGVSQIIAVTGILVSLSA